MYTNNISGLHLWTMSHTTRSATAFHNINPACTANFILLLSSPPLIVLLKLRLNHNWYPACTANVILLLSSPPLIVLLKLRLNHNWYPASTAHLSSCCYCHYHPTLLCHYSIQSSFVMSCVYALACLSAPGTQPLIYHHGSHLHWKLTMLVNHLIIAPNVLVLV